MRLATLFAMILLAFGSAVMADETEQYREIQQLLAKQQFEQAEKQLDAALSENPDSTRLKSLHYVFYIYLNRADRHLDAARHAEANIDVWLQNLTQNPNMASQFASQLNNVTSSYARAGQADVALEKLESIAGRVRKLAADNDAPEFAALATEIQARKALLLDQAEQREQGRELLDAALAEARKNFGAEPANPANVLALASVLDVRSQFESGEKAAEARRERLEFLAQQAREHASNFPIVAAYYTNTLSAVSQMLQSDAAQAEQQIGELEEFLKSLDKDNQQLQTLVRGSGRMLSSFKQRLESAKALQALIGQPAIPLDAQAWVNGGPLADEDVRGKVVLLDFWAVWCGPCIATFPHLREWHDKFTEKGLVIIGATKHYGYDWDDAASSIKKVSDLSPADEEAAMQRFAKHHKLQHRFMVTPKDSEFSKKYGVTGIPQAVLIDRNGIVRMIRVGSGEANAHDLEGMIEELIAATPENTTGG